ncbi:MFS transporter [Nonomuraea sp. NPDC059023]|uniref:MFS transporter n=1 Tax=unclassified Nonomuraea TaxID=2593643 RepID=UPI00367C0340
MTTVTVVVLYACLSIALTNNMLMPLLPSLEKAYHISAIAGIWITLVNQQAQAIFGPSLCRIGDNLDMRKRIAIVGLVSMVIGSIICAISAEFALLLLGRVLQGAGVVVFPMLTGLVTEEFTDGRRKFTVSSLQTVSFVGGGGGSVAAALLAQSYSSFEVVFWLSTVLAVVALALVIFCIPADRRARTSEVGGWRGADLFGAVGLAAPVICLQLGLTFGPINGWANPWVIGALIATPVLFLVWVRHEKRAAAPLVSMDVFFSRPVLIANLLSALTGFCVFGIVVATSSYVQMPVMVGLGVTAVVASLAVLPAESMMVVCGPVSAHLSSRYGKGVFLIGGFAVMAAGMGFLYAMHDSLPSILLALVVVGIGLGIVIPCTGLIYVEDIAPIHVGRMVMLSPIMAGSVGAGLGGVTFGALMSGMTMPGTHVPSESAFTTFWLLAAGVSLLAALVSTVYRLGERRGRLDDTAENGVLTPSAS